MLCTPASCMKQKLLRSFGIVACFFFFFFLSCMCFVCPLSCDLQKNSAAAADIACRIIVRIEPRQHLP